MWILMETLQATMSLLVKVKLVYGSNNAHSAPFSHLYNVLCFTLYGHVIVT